MTLRTSVFGVLVLPCLVLVATSCGADPATGNQSLKDGSSKKLGSGGTTSSGGATSSTPPRTAGGTASTVPAASGGFASGSGGTTTTSPTPSGGASTSSTGGTSTTTTSSTGGTTTAAASTGGTTATTVPPTASPWPSTEFARATWSDYAESPAAPAASFFVGAWTHTLEPLGTTLTGNDYPFVVPCKETVANVTQGIIMVSGNIAYDQGYGSWYYNQNIMTNTGDYATIYAHTGQFGYPAGIPDEAAIRGWVYVAWHYRPVAAGTEVNQYLKFGTGGLVLLTTDVVPNERATPTSIDVGGGPRGWAGIYMQFAKVYEMPNPPTLDQVNAIAGRTDPDPTAWADWPLIGANLGDVSGHGRNLAMNVDAAGKKGAAYSAIPGPKF